ncbi:MAG TPA: hypothetical protein VES67_10500 [Vicinamibacterales bacterium]|nr:hypothetical protein [Vicinamibacterales bacterium]
MRDNGVVMAGRKRLVSTVLAAALLAIALDGAACGGGGGNGPMNPSPNPPNPPGGSAQTLNGSVASFGYAEHTLNVSQTGNLTATLTWSGSNDLDLYLTAGNCPDVYGPNACTRLVVSELTEGNSETVSRSVQSGEQFKIWVDNFGFSVQAYTVRVEIR